MSDYAKLIKKMHDLERTVMKESFRKGNVKLNEDDMYEFPSDIDDRTLRGLLAEIKKLRKTVAKLESENEELKDTVNSYISSNSSSSSYSSGCGSSSSSYRSSC